MKQRSPKLPGMVRWYNPLQLLRTGLNIFVNEELNARADPRLLEFQSGPAPDFSEGRPPNGEKGKGEGVWFDYIADTGDGYRPTHAVARALAAPELSLGAHTLKRGDFLILGGDSVYPVASREAYEARLKRPFEDASSDYHPDPPPHIYAVAGNHDWYDGLISFTRLFTGGSRGGEGRRIGMWRTRQTRSYFSIELPGGWWIWGIDIELRGDIDEPQRAFFDAMLARLGEGERVIACTPKPDWLYEEASEDPDLPGRLEHLRGGLERQGVSVPLQLSGDIHNYQRFDSDATPGFHKVVSGGGGAFLSPTHRARKPPSGPYRRSAHYPDSATSFRLSFRCLLLPLLNPAFALTSAALYLVFAWPLFRAPDLASFVREGGSSLFLSALLVAASAFYAHPRNGYRWWGGVPHGAAQVASAYLACRFIIDAFGQPSPLSFDSFLAVCSIALAGAFVLPTLVGVYLFLSLNLFGFHPTEAFSALRIEGYKNFLRCHLDEGGTLTVYAVGIDTPDSAPRLIDRFVIDPSREHERS